MGTLLLIGIGVTLFSVLMLLVFNTSILFESKSGPTANIIVRYDGSGIITFENRGGEPIPLDSQITLNFADITPVQFTVADYLDPPPGPDDHYWAINQRVTYDASAIPNLNELEIRTMIVDPESNSVLMKGVIREGSQQAVPFVVTVTPIAVTTRSEKLNLTYDYQLYFPHAGWQYWVRFSYKKLSDTTWIPTTWTIVVVKSGFYSLILTGLSPGTSYVVKGEACWGTLPSVLPQNYTEGSTKRFDTGTDYVGLWHFNEQTPDDLTIAKDSTINHNNGTLQPKLSTIIPVRTASGVHSSPAITFDGINDYVAVPDAPSIRTFGNETTVECWVNPQTYREGREGVMTTNDVSHFSQFLENYSCLNPDVISVSGQYYAIVSRGANGHGYLAIVNITSSGQIISPNLTSSIVALQDFDTACFLPKIIHITGTVYAIVYCRGGASADRSNGYLRTLNILPTGKIGSTIGILSIAVTYFNQPKIIPVAGSIYAIFYNNGYNNYQLQVLTVNIPTVGNPTKILTTSYTLVTYDQVVVKVGNNATMNTYTLAYRDSDSDGYLASLNISNNGLTLTFIDQNPDPNATLNSIGIDSDDCWLPSITPVANTGRYVLAYTGSLNNYKNYGYIRTVAISSVGIVANGTYEYSQDFKIIDGAVSPTSYVFSAPVIIAVDTNTYVIAYQYSTTTTAFGLVQTIDINATGNITFIAHPAAPPNFGSPTEPHRFTFEIYNGCVTPTIIELQAATSPYTFAVIYSRAANLTNQGMIKTFSITDLGVIQQPRISEALLGPRHIYNPYLYRINGTTYVMIYNTEYNSGLSIATFQITNTGDIIDTLIDYVGLPSARVLSIRMRLIQNDIYCLAYDDFTAGVVIRTVRIATNGMINHTFDSLWTYPNSLLNNIDFTKVSNNPSNDIYAVSLHTSTGRFVITVHISNLGVVTGPIDTFTMTEFTSYLVVYDTSLTRLENSVGGDTDVFILTYSWAYKDISNNWYGFGKIITIQINVLTGMITDLPVATYQFDQYITKATLTRVNSDIYTLAYTDKTPYDRIKTFRISDNGSIISLVDPGTYGTTICSQILLINKTRLIYGAVSESGIIRTFRIHDKGDISNTSIGGMGWQFYDYSRSYTNCKNLRGVQLSPTVFAFIYSGLYNDAYVFTLNINAVPTKHNILHKYLCYNISADATTVYVAFTDSTSPTPITHYASAPLSYTNDWNYIVVLYKVGQRLKLYVNANDSTHNGHISMTVENMPNPIRAQNVPLMFGAYNAIYDEIGISTKTFTESEIKTNYNNMIT
jgi:hypothetical protein